MHASSRQLKLLAGLATVLLLAACGAKDDKKAATQSAARVNGAEITVHQINQVLSRVTGVTEETAPQARQEVLSRLIDQQLAVEQAQEKKLDRQPEVMAALEAARRDVLARAYLDQVVSAQSKPSAEESKKYYNDHPELFAQRRVYNLQEIAIEKNDAILPALREKVATAKSVEDIAAWLKDKGVRFAGKGGVRPAEQIPLELLVVLHPMKDGQAAVVSNPQGIAVVRIAAAQTAPVDEATALPRIQQFLANQRSKEIVDKEVKQLRDKAKIEYLGNFAPGAEAKAPAAKPLEPAVKADDSAAGNVGKAVGGLK
jgi:EpsD family peptidyl-prolyl cis-trans isomerase